MTQRMLRSGLAVVCTGLAAVLVAEISIGAMGSAVSAEPDVKVSASLDVPALADIDSMVATILERPLFASSRVPYEEAVAAGEDEEQDAPQQLQVRLTGVAILPEGREALFEREGGKPVAVKEGGQVDGWTVKAIRTDQVVLSNASGEEMLEPLNPAPSARPRVAANRAPAAPTQQKGAPTIRAPEASPGSKQDHQ